MNPSTQNNNKNVKQNQKYNNFNTLLKNIPLYFYEYFYILFYNVIKDFKRKTKL